MCLAVPAEVVELHPDQTARVDMGGVSLVVCAALIEDLRVGDYVLVHVGHALARIDPVEARKTLDLLVVAAGAPP